MRRQVIALAGFLAIAFAAPVAAAQVPLPASPSAWVTDNAGFLSPSTRDELSTRLAAYQRATGHQVIVWIDKTTGDTPLEDWTIHAFTRWKIGRKGLDDGLALFIFAQDRKIRIEVGYGLEGQVTDAVASRIIRDDIAPRLKAGDADGAVTAGVSALLATIGGEQGSQAAPVNPSSGNVNSGDVGNWLWVLFVALILLAIFVRIPTWWGFMIYSIAHGSSEGSWGSGSGGGFSGGFGGGGFSGGGGGGGGGGASGGW